MDDDWRLRIDLHEHGLAHSLVERFDSTGLEHRLESTFQDRIVVSREGSEIFCYAGTREQAERVEQLARSLAAENSWEIETELRRWHPVAEKWEDPDEPLPSTEQQRADEHAELIESEREEEIPEFEVRVECSSRDAARELAERLRQEGLPAVVRSRYVIVGARDEDSAVQLAQRIRSESPPGSLVETVATPGAVRAAEGPNPFAVFGGMGG